MIGEKTAEVAAFWEARRAELGLADEHYHASTFADPAFSTKVDEIGRLAAEGPKRATAHLALDFEFNGLRRRQPGECWVVLGAANQPLCLVRVTRVEVVPFNAAPESLALAEGEGDLSLEYWATVHRRYFARQCAAWGREWREDLAIVCEYFDRLWPD